MGRRKRPMVVDNSTEDMSNKSKRVICFKTDKQRTKTETVMKNAKTQRVYRNNLKAFIDLTERLKRDNLYTSHHSVYLSKLPMAGFMDMILDGIISPAETTKNSTTLDLIIKSYKKHLKYFQFGDLVLTFTVDDIAELLAAPVQGDLIKTSGHLKKEDKNDEQFKAFIQRHFKDEATINKKNVEREIFATIQEDSEEACFDTAKLLLLYLTATFLVSSPTYSLPWTLIPYCVCERKLSRISWPKTIHHHLCSQVNKYYETPRKISACVTLFLWWICEKTHVLPKSKDEYNDLYPLAGKWDIKMLKPSMLLDIKYNNDIQGKEIKVLKQAIEKDEEYEVFYKKREQKFKDLITKLKQENRHLKEENTMLKKRIQEFTAYSSSEYTDNSSNNAATSSESAGTASESADTASESADTATERADTATENAADEQLLLKDHDEMNFDQDNEENESVEEEDDSEENESGEEEDEKKDDHADKTDDKNDEVDNNKGDDKDEDDDKIDYMEIDIASYYSDDEKFVAVYSRDAEGDNENNNASKSIGQKEQEEENDVEKVDEARKDNKDKKEEHEKENEKEKEKVQEHQSLLKEKDNEEKNDETNNAGKPKDQKEQEKKQLQDKELEKKIEQDKENDKDEELLMKMICKKHDQDKEIDVEQEKEKEHQSVEKEKEKKMKQTESLDIDDYGSEPRSVETRIGTKLKIRKYKNVRNLEEHQIKQLEEFFTVSDLSKSAYLNGDDDICILGVSLADLIVGKFIDGQIINWFAHELQKNFPEIIYISTFASTLLMNDSMENLKVMVNKRVEEEYDECTKVFIPIYSENHFTLLEFAKEGRRWIHYDSMKPRREGEHQRIARKMRNYINAVMKKIEKKNYKIPKQIEFSDCPQQGPTVDCAIFVMNIMKQRSEKKEIDKEDEIYTAEAADLQRAVLAYEILNCKPYSWTAQENLTQAYLLSTSNLNKLN